MYGLATASMTTGDYSRWEAASVGNTFVATSGIPGNNPDLLIAISLIADVIGGRGLVSRGLDIAATM